MIERAGNSAAWVELQPLTGRTHQLLVHMAAIGHPIVGAANWRISAFLTGTISRKMHLHSRRLRIDHPDGGTIDISAELPTHFAASLDDLGFDMLLGDIGLDAGEKGPPPKSALKAQAKAHSKQIRKARRGERRGRTADGKPTDFVGKPKPKAKAGKPGSKPPPKKPTQEAEAKKHPARATQSELMIHSAFRPSPSRTICALQCARSALPRSLRARPTERASRMPGGAERRQEHAAIPSRARQRADLPFGRHQRARRGAGPDAYVSGVVRRRRQCARELCRDRNGRHRAQAGRQRTDRVRYLSASHEASIGANRHGPATK